MNERTIHAKQNLAAEVIAIRRNGDRDRQNILPGRGLSTNRL